MHCTYAHTRFSIIRGVAFIVRIYQFTLVFGEKYESSVMSTSVDDALAFATSKLGLEDLKHQQKRALQSFLRGHDVFVCLPTGFGKSVVFQAAPFCHEFMNKVDGNSFVIVVVPLKALVRDQVERCKGLNISAADMTGGVNDNLRHELCMGNISILFTSPGNFCQM